MQSLLQWWLPAPRLSLHQISASSSNAPIHCLLLSLATQERRLGWVTLHSHFNPSPQPNYLGNLANKNAVSHSKRMHFLDNQPVSCFTTAWFLVPRRFIITPAQASVISLSSWLIRTADQPTFCIDFFIFKKTPIHQLLFIIITS